MNTEIVQCTLGRGNASAPFDPGRVRILASTALALVGVVGWQTVAHAQAKPAGDSLTIEEVVVTGSLLRGANVVGVPVVTYGQKQIEETGVSNLTDLLHQVANIPRVSLDPQNTAREPSNFTNISTVNIHGLDSNSTLTLLNGTRAANAGTQFVGFDLSAIPTNAVSRLDVLADGSSATYGSDAVAGVVNVILRKPFDGAESAGRVGYANGYSTRQVGQTLGKTWNKGGVFFAYQYTSHSNLPASARSYYTDNWTVYGGDNQQLVPPYKGVADPANITVGPPGPGQAVYSVPKGQNGKGLTVANLTKGVLNTQSTFLGTDAIGSENRNNAVLTFVQELTDKVVFDADAYFNIRQIDRNGRALAANTPGSTSVIVPNTNPFFITGIPGTSATETTKYSFYQDFGAALNTATERSYRVAGNLKFDLGHQWNADVHAATSNDWLSTGNDNFSPTALAAALADPNPATAFNPFGAGSFNNPATLAKIRGLQTRVNQYTVNDLVAKADGPTFALPGGPLRVAAGLEIRQDSLARDARDNYLTGATDTSTFETYVHVREQRTVQSAFAEALVPIIGSDNAQPWARRLSLSLAARYDHYSDFGDTANPKVGLDWLTGIPGLSIEATYGTSYRAPTLVEKDGITGLTTASLSLTPNGPALNGLLLQQDGGSRLRPVTSATYTAGFDYQPDWLKGAKAFVHYYSVDTNHYITSPVVGADALYNPLYSKYIITLDPAAANALTAQYLATLTASRNIIGSPPVVGQVNFVFDDRDFNLGKSQTSGVDFGLDYGWSSAFGQWVAGVDGTYVSTFRQQPTEGGSYQELVNTNNAAPLRLVGRFKLDWRIAGFHSNLIYNYQNAYTNTDYPNAGTPPYATVKSYGTTDLTLGYDTGSQAPQPYLRDISLGVRIVNLFDTPPPIALTPDAVRTPIPIDTYHSDVLGRTISVSVSKKW